MQWRWFSKKHNGPTPADDIAPQIITDCGNLTLDFKQLGLWASPPFLQTLGPWFPMKYKTCSHLKRGLGPLGNSPVLLLLSPGNSDDNCSQIPWHICVWWLLMPWPQPQSIPCEVHPKFLNRFCLTILIRLRFSWLVVHLFLPHFFLPLNFLLTCLDTATLWTASFFGNECLWLTLLVKGVNDCLLDNCQISSLHHDCVA